MELRLGKAFLASEAGVSCTSERRATWQRDRVQEA
jgi:hypothetical protein